MRWHSHFVTLMWQHYTIFIYNYTFKKLRISIIRKRILHFSNEFHDSMISYAEVQCIPLALTSNHGIENGHAGFTRRLWALLGNLKYIRDLRHESPSHQIQLQAISVGQNCETVVKIYNLVNAIYFVLEIFFSTGP